MIKTPRYSLRELVNESGITSLGWSELARIASIATSKSSAGWQLHDDVEAEIVADGAEFLLKVWKNTADGTYPEPKSVGGMMMTRARNAASNWLYHNRFKPTRVMVAASNAYNIAREGGLSL